MAEELILLTVDVHEALRSTVDPVRWFCGRDRPDCRRCVHQNVILRCLLHLMELEVCDQNESHCEHGRRTTLIKSESSPHAIPGETGPGMRYSCSARPADTCT